MVQLLSVPNLPQICIASAQLYDKSILKQMQYIFAVNFWKLCILEFLVTFIYYGFIKAKTLAKSGKIFKSYREKRGKNK